MIKYYRFMVIGALLGVLMGACAKEEGMDYPVVYNSGKQSFESAEKNIAVFMSFFDLSLRVNAYLALPEDEREEAEDDYFHDYVISRDEEGRWMGLKGTDTVFTVMPDDLGLTTETAVWQLSGCSEDYNGAMKVVCTGERDWTLELNGVINEQWYSDARLQIQYQGEGLPENFDEGSWVITGSGSSSSGMTAADKKEMIFEVAEPLVKDPDSRYLFGKGILFIKLTDQDGLREERIKAELKSYAEHGRQLQITYQKELYIYNDDGESVLSVSDAG